MSFRHDVAVIGGCGHVGLPLGIALADRGLDVVLFDIDQRAVDLVNAGELPAEEPGALEMLRRVVGTRLTASTSPAVISGAETVVVVIGTPVDGHLSPDPQAVPRALEELVDYLRDGQLLVLRSTVYPGVTAQVEKLVERHSLSVDVALLPGAHRRGPCHDGAVRAPPDRVGAGSPGAEAGRRPLPPPDGEDRAPPARGSGAGEAVHQRLAVHQVRPWSPREPAGRRSPRPGASACPSPRSRPLELAELIWRKVKGPDVPFRHVSDPSFEYDVQRRVPATEKARKVLGFEATTTLDEMLDEVIPWIERAIADGTI